LFFTILAIASLPAAELKLPPELRTLVEAATAAPPEFSAQAMLRIVASGKVADKPTRRALLIQAFQSAGIAHERIARRGIPGLGLDTQAGALDAAYKLNLDSLTLQSQAVKLLLRDDKPMARELFSEIPRPEIPALSCEDFMTYDPSAFYESLQSVVELAFTDAERKKEDHVAYVLDHLAGITSPSQLAPAAHLVNDAAGFTPKQREALINRFNIVMDGMNLDTQAFAVGVGDIENAISAPMRGSFDKLRQRMDEDKTCEGKKPDPPVFFQTSGAKAIFTLAKSVRFGDGKKTWNDADRQTPEWIDQFTALLASLRSGNPDPDESAATYYHERTTLYQGLMDVAPTAALRRLVLVDFAAFVNASTVQRDNPVEWFAPVKAMWGRIPFKEAGEQAACAEVLTQTGNPVMILYLMMEKAMPQPFGGSQ
jgi:hypothetical protein